MSFRLTPVAASNWPRTPAYTFSYTRGTLGRDVGRTCGSASAVRIVGEEGDREADAGADEVHQLPEVVGERQVQQHRVRRVDERRALVAKPLDRRGHLPVVPVPDHAALRRPGRSGREMSMGEGVLWPTAASAASSAPGLPAAN